MIQDQKYVQINDHVAIPSCVCNLMVTIAYKGSSYIAILLNMLSTFACMYVAMCGIVGSWGEFTTKTLLMEQNFVTFQLMLWSFSLRDRLFLFCLFSSKDKALKE